MKIYILSQFVKNMTTIFFDEPSVANVAGQGKPALYVENTGTAATGEIQTTGVSGISDAEKGYGVYGGCRKSNGYGVVGQADGEHGRGVWGVSWGAASGIGVYGEGPTAGHFEGNVEVTGDIKLLNGDCAEDFDITEPEENGEAGTVMVLTENGSLAPSHQEYDKKVAGIVSGAGGYKPAIVLDSQHSQSENDKDQSNKNKHRLPIALMGKVYCKVDATHSSVRIGDLLTTSPTKGYAMKAEDPMKAFGAVIGKALGPIREGLGMIPVLVALQ
jgi:hypothetical protein